MTKSEGRGLGYGPPYDTVSRPDIRRGRLHLSGRDGH